MPFLYCKFVLFLVSHRGSDAWPVMFHFTYKNKRFQFALAEGSPDVAALVETFVDEEYALPGLINPKVVLDVGAHTGNTSWYFHLRYPEAMVMAIEASPKNFAQLQTNVAQVQAIVPIHCALAGQSGEIEFFETASSLGSSTKKRHDHDQSMLVPAKTLKQLFVEQRISRADVIKIDIEGGEADLFTENDPTDFSDRYIIEVHEDLMDVSGAEFEELFSRYSCTRIPLPQPGRYLLDCQLLVA